MALTIGQKKIDRWRDTQRERETERERGEAERDRDSEGEIRRGRIKIDRKK